jgi:hypothetical protein
VSAVVVNKRETGVMMGRKDSKRVRRRSAKTPRSDRYERRDRIPSAWGMGIGEASVRSLGNQMMHANPWLTFLRFAQLTRRTAPRATCVISVKDWRTESWRAQNK